MKNHYKLKVEVDACRYLFDPVYFILKTGEMVKLAWLSKSKKSDRVPLQD